jgi:hypothetical protein
VAYRILIASLVVCLLLVGGLLVLERTALIEIDEKAIQPEVVSCQVGHNDMKVSVQGNRDYYPWRGCPEVRVLAPSVRRVRRLLLGQAQSGIGHSPTPIETEFRILHPNFQEYPKAKFAEFLFYEVG